MDELDIDQVFKGDSFGKWPLKEDSKLIVSSMTDSTFLKLKPARPQGVRIPPRCQIIRVRTKGLEKGRVSRVITILSSSIRSWTKVYRQMYS